MSYVKGQLVKTKMFEYLHFGRVKKAVAMAYLDEAELVAMARKAVERNKRPETVAGALKIKVLVDD